MITVAKAYQLTKDMSNKDKRDLIDKLTASIQPEQDDPYRHYLLDTVFKGRKLPRKNK